MVTFPEHAWEFKPNRFLHDFQSLTLFSASADDSNRVLSRPSSSSLTATSTSVVARGARPLGLGQVNSLPSALTLCLRVTRLSLVLPLSRLHPHSPTRRMTPMSPTVLATVTVVLFLRLASGLSLVFFNLVHNHAKQTAHLSMMTCPNTRPRSTASWSLIPLTSLWFAPGASSSATFPIRVAFCFPSSRISHDGKGSSFNLPYDRPTFPRCLPRSLTSSHHYLPASGT